MRKKEALLIIDMLNDFVQKGAPLEVPSTRSIISSIQKEVKTARSKGRSVIYICDYHKKKDPEFNKMGWPAHAVKGSKGAEIVKELKPHKGDYIIRKSTYSGFYKTRLDALLRKLEIKNLRFTGCVTNICILYTASDAVLRGYDVTVKKNCVAGLSPQTHRFSLLQMKDVLGVHVV